MTGNNTENWKGVRGFWDGSKKTGGRSGCGVVMKGVDRDKWITFSTIALPLTTCTAMAAEVVGSRYFDWRLGFGVGNISVENIHQCIDEIIKVHTDRRLTR